MPVSGIVRERLRAAKQFHRILLFGSINLERGSGTRWTGRLGPDRANKSTSASLARTGWVRMPGQYSLGVLPQQLVSELLRLSLTPRGEPRHTFQRREILLRNFVWLRARCLRAVRSTIDLARSQSFVVSGEGESGNTPDAYCRNFAPSPGSAQEVMPCPMLFLDASQIRVR